VLATHQFGIPCEIEKTIELAKENHCVVIEDCAAAFGSRVMGKLVGAFGLASIFSFEFTKVLSAGRGGFILFNDEDLFEKVRLLTNKELNKPSPLFMGKIMSMLFLHKVLTIPFVYSFFIRVFYEKYGFSMDKGEISPRMDALYRHALSPIEATIGLSNLKRVERIIRRRWEVAGQYLNSLAEIKDFGLPVLPPDSFCSWMRFPVRVLHQDKRDFYLACLKRGLDLGFTYAYSCSEQCKNSELAARQVVNLPMNSNLTGGEVMKIIKVVKDVIGAGG
jgi:dTDP-4-amino-4,6-dideoxygalactose transaminase